VINMTTSTAPDPTLATPLRARAVAYALLARLLGPDPAALADAETLAALRAALGTADEQRALGRLADATPVGADTVPALAGTWVRWFDLGRVAPYEGSNVASTAGGVTPRLADVAAFYRAFGTEVTGERPDHVVAQLEFLALALLLEAEARETGDDEHAQVTTAAVRSFVRDHAGVWIGAWAARVAEIEALAPWTPFAAAAADLVAAEAGHRGVIPLTDAAVLPADAGVPDDDEGLLACEEL
jgi:nitrate reductase assembly molybdenum cofactor insertion protein NarJ